MNPIINKGGIRMRSIRKGLLVLGCLLILCGCSEDTSPEYILDTALTQVETLDKLETTLTIDGEVYQVKKENDKIYVDGKIENHPSKAILLAVFEPLLDGFYDFEKTENETGYEIRFLLRESNDDMLEEIFNTKVNTAVCLLKTNQKMMMQSMEIKANEKMLKITLKGA